MVLFWLLEVFDVSLWCHKLIRNRYARKRQYCNNPDIQREREHREDYPCGIHVGQVLPYPRD